MFDNSGEGSLRLDWGTARGSPSASATGWSKLNILPQTIRGKLAAAFAAIVVTTVIAAFVLQSSYDVIDEKIAIITDESVPSVVCKGFETWLDHELRRNDSKVISSTTRSLLGFLGVPEGKGLECEPRL